MNQTKFSFHQRVYIFSSFIFLLVLFGCGISVNNKNSVTVKQSDHGIDIDNGRVRLQLSFDSSVVKQNYFTKNNGAWKLVAESFYGSGKTFSNVMPLYRKGPDVAGEYRLMANEGFSSARVIEENNEAVKIGLSGKLSGKLSLIHHIHFTKENSKTTGS